MKLLDNVAERDVPKIKVPTGKPLVYEIDRKKGDHGTFASRVRL